MAMHGHPAIYIILNHLTGKTTAHTESNMHQILLSTECEAR